MSSLDKIRYTKWIPCACVSLTSNWVIAGLNSSFGADQLGILNHVCEAARGVE